MKCNIENFAELLPMECNHLDVLYQPPLVREGLCRELGRWKHPRYPTGVFCNHHKEIIKGFYPIDWSLLEMTK